MTMGARSSAREAALQMLFAADVAKHSAATLIRDFWREFPGDPQDREYADSALSGTLEERASLDEKIVAASNNWRLERMTVVARNVLRLGTWELLHHPEVPRAVVIDEAVELAKRFDSKDSAAFVNGVLDRIAENCGRRDSDRPTATADPATRD